MSTGPRPLPGPSPAGLRQRARRDAEGVSGALVPIIGGVLAVLFVVLFAVLDYGMHQSSARILKVLLSATALVGIAMTPALGLFLFASLTPMLPLLPKLPVAGVNTLNLLVLAIFVPFALGRVLARRPFMRKGMLTVPILALITVVWLSVLRGAAFPTGYTYDAGQASLFAFRASMTFLAYLITLAMVVGGKARRRMAWAIAIAALVESVYTMKSGRVMHGGRALGSIGQPNELGAYLAMAAPFALALMFGVRSWWQKALLLLITGLSGFALLLTASRAALVAIGVAMLVVVARSSRWALVAMVLVLAASPLWLPQNVKDRITSTQVSSGASDDKQLEGGAQERVDTWHTILHVVQDHALDGIGFTGLANVLPQMGEDLGLNVKDSSHNTFLRMLSETGVLGLGLFLYLFWRSWRLGERGMRLAKTRMDRQIALGVVAGVVSLAISCAFGDRFWGVTVVGNLWVACALTDDMVIERRREAA